jgi:putative sterol carrier protein
MAYFKDEQEVYKYLGGVFKVAGDDPTVGPKLKGADIVLKVDYSDPDCEVTVVMKEPEIRVIEGPSDEEPDITLIMPADIADQFWRGKYNLAVGLAKSQVKAKGPVNKILKLVPLTKPVFPMYREMVEEKDGAAA